MIIDSLRHFVLHAGVDGFRFDLATILGRGPTGFHSGAQTLSAISNDAVLADRVLIAEPWDIGPGGYRLGEFGEPWLEWNDRYRDDVRRFWRGETMVADLATRLAGSFDMFSGVQTRSVSYVASHDGFTLADLASYDRKHNDANCEGNRDGHDANFSTNHGAEGPTDDAAINAARTGTIKAMLATLFATRGTIMLTAGDELGRSQQGNNNAYAQDNPIVWIDWSHRNSEIEETAIRLSAIRRRFPQAFDPARLDGRAVDGHPPEVEWLRTDGEALSVADWEDAGRDHLAMVLATGTRAAPRIAVLFNRSAAPTSFTLPGFRAPLLQAAAVSVAARSVVFLVEGE
jgi:glycogen operon protein